MISLVSISDLQDLKYIASSVKNNDSWIQFVSEAQQLDVKIWLGDALLNELVVQKTTPPYSAANTILLNGGAYVHNTYTYLFQGLRNCIAYYAFARFTNRTAFNYTAAGIVMKDSDLSTPIPDKIMQRLETEARLTAEAIKCEVILFLNRNYATYPLWHQEGLVCGCGCADSRGIFQVIGD